MIRCIYCLEEKEQAAFRKVEHVIPQSFGLFKENFTLNETVCDACNQYFGDNIELYLARGSWEGLARFLHGLKGPEQYKGLGKRSNIVLKLGEGQMKGANAHLVYSEKQNELVLSPVPQVGFLKKADSNYLYFLLDEIPEKIYLEANGFDLISPKGIIFFGDPVIIDKKLKEKNISFKIGGFETAPMCSTPVLTEVEWTADHKILRGIAKIAFNYLAYWKRTPFVLRSDFNAIREFIRYGKKADYPLVRPINVAILGDEPFEGRRRQGHIVTTSWADDGVSIMSRLTLFNDITYCVSLARNFPDPNIEITKGHFFNTKPEQLIITEIKKRD